VPNIVEYNAQSNLEPTDRGIQAAEIAGRRIGLFYHQLADDVKGVADAVQQHMSVMESSELYKTGTQMQLNLRQRYEAESALPENRNDPHFGDRFMAEVQPIIEKWQGGASTDHGKMLASTLGNDIYKETFNYVHAGQSEMDTAHVVDNAKQTGNTLGAGLITDPSEGNLNRSIGTMNDAVDGMTMTIPDVSTRERVATELKGEYLPNLVIARYRGVAESIKNQVAETGDETKSPAKDQLDKDIANQVGFQYLSPEQQSALTTLRDEAVRQGKELFNTADAAQRKKDSDDFDAAILPIETSLFQDNGAGGVTMAVTPQALEAVQRAAQMPGAKQHPEKIEALLNAMHTATQDKLAGKETVTDHGTFVQLSSEIGSSSNPLTTTEVDKAYAQGKLAEEDYHFLRTSAVDSKQSAPKAVHAFTELNQWLARIKPMIDKSNPLLGNLDQTGVQNFSYFSWDATQKLKQMIAAGYDPEHALTMMTDPRNPRGLYHFIPQYQVHDGKAGLKSVIQSISTGTPQPIVAPPGGVRQAPPPRGANESTDAYLKRTGG
jgi:hypothetical protein